jgi:hypothetical protein
MRTPLVSVQPVAVLAVSQDGAVTKYLTEPLDALTRYEKSAGENGPPAGPATLIPLEGETISDGSDVEPCAVAVEMLAANINEVR